MIQGPGHMFEGPSCTIWLFWARASEVVLRLLLMCMWLKHLDCQKTYAKTTVELPNTNLVLLKAFNQYFIIVTLLPNTALVLPRCFPILLQYCHSTFKYYIGIAMVLPNTNLVLAGASQYYFNTAQGLRILLFGVGPVLRILLWYCPRAPNTILVLPQCFQTLL